MDVNVRYENRNGRLYAYTSTSRRVPGHKNPVSVKEYIGVVDPVTGDIVEKHPRSGSRTAMLDGSSVSNHGDVLLALTMAERMGILDDLRQVFGERHKRILAVILAQTIRPSMSDRLDVVFEMSGLSEVLGMDRMTSDDVYDAVSDISREDMSSFFRRRHIRNPGVRFVYALAIPVVSEGAVSSVTMGSAGISDCVTIVIMMSQSGELIEFRSLGRIQDSIGAIGGILGDVEDGEECVFIPDARLSPYLDLSGLVRSGIGFAIPFVPPSIQFGAVHQDYADVEGKEFQRNDMGNRYHLMTGRTWVRWSPEGYSLVPSSDPCHRECDFVLPSYMCYDPREYRRVSESMRIAIESFRTQLDGKVFEDPDREFSRIVGPWSRVLRHSEDECGRMSVSVRRKELSKILGQSGKTFVLSSSVTWDDLLAAHDARVRADRAVSQYHRGAQSLLNYHCSRIDSESFVFIEFIVVMIYKQMQKMLDDGSVPDMDIEKAFLIASTDRVVHTDEGDFRSSHSRKLARVYRLFQVDPSRHWDFE